MMFMNDNAFMVIAISKVKFRKNFTHMFGLYEPIELPAR